MRRISQVKGVGKEYGPATAIITQGLVSKVSVVRPLPLANLENTLHTGLPLRPTHIINHCPVLPSLPEPDWHLMGRGAFGRWLATERPRSAKVPGADVVAGSEPMGTYVLFLEPPSSEALAAREAHRLRSREC